MLGLFFIIIIIIFIIFLIQYFKKNRRLIITFKLGTINIKTKEHCVRPSRMYSNVLTFDTNKVVSVDDNVNDNKDDDERELKFIIFYMDKNYDNVDNIKWITNIDIEKNNKFIIILNTDNKNNISKIKIN